MIGKPPAAKVPSFAAGNRPASEKAPQATFSE
jgi:hypothetical protein